MSRADVKPGDILLLQYQAEDNAVAEALKLLSLAKQAVEDWKNWAAYDQDTRKRRFSALMPLVHFAITAFDANRYFHAAVVGLDAQGQAVVVEAGTSGVNQTPLADYWDGPISVYRYHKGAVTLGDRALPAAPVLDKAAGFAGDRAIEYGYLHAGLLAIWCLFRAGEDQVLDRLHRAASLAIGEKAADRLFDLIGRETIRLLLVDVFHKALDRWRQGKHLVCSELVAACFNQADEAGTYQISRTEEPVAATSSPAQPPGTQPATGEVSDALASLAASVRGLEITRPLRAVDVTLALISSDVLYTPSDLERSVNTRHMGDMAGKG
jgi:hypothetical protein